MSKEDKPLLVITESPATLRARFEDVINRPDILERICEQIANGGSLVAMCRFWAISHRKLYNWIKSQPGGKAMYEEALELRQEWEDEMAKSDLLIYAQSDIRKLFTEDGHIIAPHDLDDDTAASLQSVQVKTRTYDDGSKETTHEFKLIDKLKTRDMLLRTRGKYLDKMEHSGSVTLEDILAKSWGKKDET